MKVVKLVLGIVVLMLGLHWIGQGTGLFIWPSNPAMDNQIRWAYYGVVAAVIGLALIWFSRRN